MAKKTAAAKTRRYVCVADYGCGLQYNRKNVWLDFGDTISLTEPAAKNALAQRLIKEA